MRFEWEYIGEFVYKCGMSKDGVKKKEFIDNEFFWKVRLGKFKFFVLFTIFCYSGNFRVGIVRVVWELLSVVILKVKWSVY